VGATARLLGLPVIGFDRYARGSGQMRWRLAGAIPVMSADGDDITRSAAGRHAGELLLAASAAALPPDQLAPVDTDHVIARIPVGPQMHEVALTVAPSGALTEVVMSRWDNPDRQQFMEHTFGAQVAGEVTRDGYTIPRTVTAGWYYGTDRWAAGQFIRYAIHDARLPGSRRRAQAPEDPRQATDRRGRSGTFDSGRGHALDCRLEP